jgi:50S ribosomal subunit-associated GTPase HflX
MGQAWQAEEREILVSVSKSRTGRRRIAGLLGFGESKERFSEMAYGILYQRLTFKLTPVVEQRTTTRDSRKRRTTPRHVVVVHIIMQDVMD